MDNEFPWIYVAMIVIAFISWVFNRIQEATAERNRAQELKRRELDEEERPGQPPPLPARGESRPAAERRVETLQDLIEALGGPPQPVRESPRPSQAPASTAAHAKAPPAPRSKSPATPESRLSPAEREALERIRRSSAATAGPTSLIGITRARAPEGGASGEVRRLLRSGGGLRQAMVLKELLDKPISMRRGAD